MILNSQIKEIISGLIYNYVFISSYYKAKEGVRLTNPYLDFICTELAHMMILKIINIVDYRKSLKRADDVRINYSDYSEKSQKIFRNFVDKYKKYRNKKIAHTTKIKIDVRITLEDFRIILSALEESDVYILDETLTPFFENLLLIGSK